MAFVITRILIFEIFRLTGLIKYIPFKVFFMIAVYGSFGSILGYMFALGLGIEWLYMVYSPNLGTTLKFIYNYLILILYLIGSILFSLLLTLEKYWNYHILLLTSKILYFSFVLFIIVCNIVQYKRRNVDNKDTYILNIASILILFWLLEYFYDELLTWSYGSYTLYTIFLFTMDIPQLFAYSTPIAIITILKTNDEHFRRAIEKRNLWKLKNFKGNSEDEVEEYNVISDTNNISNV